MYKHNSWFIITAVIGRTQKENKKSLLKKNGMCKILFTSPQAQEALLSAKPVQAEIDCFEQANLLPRSSEDRWAIYKLRRNGGQCVFPREVSLWKPGEKDISADHTQREREREITDTRNGS